VDAVRGGRGSRDPRLPDAQIAASGRERRRRARVGERVLEPAAQQHAVGRGDPPVPGLAAALIEVVNGDLPPVDVQSATTPIGGLLDLHNS